MRYEESVGWGRKSYGGSRGFGDVRAVVDTNAAGAAGGRGIIPEPSTTRQTLRCFRRSLASATQVQLLCSLSLEIEVEIDISNEGKGRNRR